MPVIKVDGGYTIPNTNIKPTTKEHAEEILRAIYASKNARAKKVGDGLRKASKTEVA